jgi:hypothetical protein
MVGLGLVLVLYGVMVGISFYSYFTIEDMIKALPTQVSV